MPVFTPEQVDVCKAAVDTWGADAQLDMVQEELAELIVALAHHRRRRATREEVIGEVADVAIVLVELQFLLKIDDRQIAEAVARKMDRLRERVAEPSLHYGTVNV